MSIDALTKKYFFILTGTAIASAAFFQARGIAHLVAADVSSEIPPAEPTPVLGAISVEPKVRSADPILAHNVFDSETGPLLGFETPPAVVLPPRDGEAGPSPCTDAKVRLIIGGKPEHSFAAVAHGGGSPQLRRIGDDVGPYKVEAITWDNVILANGANRCAMRVLTAENQAGAAAPRPATPSARPSSAASKFAVPDEIKDKIRKVGENQFEVDRSAVDLLLEEQAKLMGSAKLRPEADGGMKVLTVRNGSILDMFGIQRGDVFKSINGFDIGDPEKALEAYSRLRTASNLALAIERGGQPVNIDVNIK